MLFKGLERKLENRAKEQLEIALVQLADKIDEYTPEDTFELKSKTKIKEVERTSTWFKWSVVNADPKAIYVEHGQIGKTFNYYKNSGRRNGGSPFYSGQWAHMFRRAKKNLQKTILQNFKIITKNL